MIFPSLEDLIDSDIVFVFEDETTFYVKRLSDFEDETIWKVDKAERYTNFIDYSYFMTTRMIYTKPCTIKRFLKYFSD